MDYTVRFTEAGMQLAIAAIRKLPIEMAGELYDDMRAQILQQEAGAAAAEREAIAEQVRATRPSKRSKPA